MYPPLLLRIYINEDRIVSHHTMYECKNRSCFLSEEVARVKNGHIKKKIAGMVQDRIKTSGTEEKNGVSTPDEEHADGMEAERTNLSDGMANHVAGGGRPGDPTPPRR